MAELVADYVLRRLKQWGVHRIYGYPEPDPERLDAARRGDR